MKLVNLASVHLVTIGATTGALAEDRLFRNEQLYPLLVAATVSLTIVYFLQRELHLVFSESDI